MPIQSKCPKCNNIGSQIYNKKARSTYLMFQHGHGNMCYIGRIKTTEEMMGELNRPETQEEYKKAMGQMTKEINLLITHYSNANSGSVQKIIKSLKKIMTSHGY